MLEIIAIIFLSKNNGKLAESKGLKSGLWILYTVLAWIGAEVIGVTAGILLFDENIFIGYILGIAFAIASYFILKNILEKKPDLVNEEEISRIGVSDLYPPDHKG
jgi:hypothetical protein